MTLAVQAGGAYAAAPNTTSITLVCDKNVDATASLTLQPSVSDTTFLGHVDISCGPSSNVARPRNRVDLPTGALAAGWVVVDSWTNSADTTGVGCTAAGAITFKDSCTNSGGVGSQLTVR
jgi:hypothetical protein